MKPERRLKLVQVIGALSLLPYPVVAFTSVIALASVDTPAGGSDFLFRGVLIVALVYPAFWAAMWWASWRAMRGGRGGLALLLSATPALVTAAGLAAFVANGVYLITSFRSFGQTFLKNEEDKARPLNRLSSELISLEAGRSKWETVRKDIESADPEMLSKAIPGDGPGAGSPLRIAIWASELGRCPSFEKPPPGRTSRLYARPAFVEAAQLLVKRGAHLSPEEEANEPNLVWLVDIFRRGITLPDAAANRENLLIGPIVSCEFDAERHASEYTYSHPELVNVETATYGTPLRAALQRGFSDAARETIRNGGALSEKEQAIPSLAQRLDHFLSFYDLREKYAENVKRRS